MKRGLLALAVILVILAGGLTYRWMQGADALRAIVEANLAHAQETLRTQPEPLTFEYASLRISGFPFSHHARLKEPRLTLKQLNHTMAVTAEFLDVIPEDSAFERFSIVAPGNFTAVEVFPQREARYQVTAEPMPELSFRLPADELRGVAEQGLRHIPQFTARTSETALKALLPMLFHQYALRFPRNVTLTAQHQEKTRPIAFAFAAALPLRLWLPMRYDIGYPMEIFFGMLAEAMERQP